MVQSPQKVRAFLINIKIGLSMERTLSSCLIETRKSHRGMEVAYLHDWKYFAEANARMRGGTNPGLSLPTALSASCPRECGALVPGI